VNKGGGRWTNRSATTFQYSLQGRRVRRLYLLESVQIDGHFLGDQTSRVFERVQGHANTA